MNTKKFLLLETIGIIFNLVLSTILDFSPQIFGDETWIIIFSSANDSIWEHIKIFFLPYAIWTIIELASTLKPSMRRLVTIKVFSIYFFAISYILYFYISLLFCPPEFNCFLMPIFYILSLISYLISFSVFVNNKNIERFFVLSLNLLVLFVLMYLNFTANPPKLAIFKDPKTQIYGIMPQKFDFGATSLSSHNTK